MLGTQAWWQGRCSELLGQAPALQLSPPPAEAPHKDRLSWPSGQTFLDCSPSGDLEVTVDFLTEVDKLVQLIECPIFTCKGPASGLGLAWHEAGVKPPSERREGGGRECSHPRDALECQECKAGDGRAETRWSRAGTHMAPARVPPGGAPGHTSTDSKTHLKVSTIPAREN